MSDISLFKNISNNEISDILKLLDSRIVLFKKGMTVQFNLNNSSEIGIVNFGRVSLIRVDYDGSKSVVSEFKKNDIFGACFTNSKNDELSIVADNNSEIIFIEYSKLIMNDSTLSKWHNIIISNIFDIMAKKINYANLRIELLTKKTIREKLLEYFRILQLEQGRIKITIPNNYTRLAEYLSVDRCSLMRELKNLKNDGIIEVSGKVVTLIIS